MFPLKQTKGTESEIVPPKMCNYGPPKKKYIEELHKILQNSSNEEHVEMKGRNTVKKIMYR